MYKFEQCTLLSIKGIIHCYIITGKCIINGAKKTNTILISLMSCIKFRYTYTCISYMYTEPIIMYIHVIIVCVTKFGKTTLVAHNNFEEMPTFQYSLFS